MHHNSMSTFQIGWLLLNYLRLWAKTYKSWIKKKKYNLF